jgi:glycerophosphoryl diester phosphodiesterase
LHQTLIAAHRGGSHLWPENSLLAFRKTVALPVDMVEFDVHRTRDGVLVVHHDATIERMTDGSGAISDMTFDELSRFVIKGTEGERVPTLAEVLEIFGPSPVDLRLEIKPGRNLRAYDGMEEQIARMLLERNLLERTLLTSFLLPCLRRFRVAIASWPVRPLDLMWLVNPMVLACSGLEGVLAAREHDTHALGLHVDDLSEDVVATLRSAEIIPHAWAAHTQDSARRMFALGIASFTTDRPDLALAARADAERPDAARCT